MHTNLNMKPKVSQGYLTPQVTKKKIKKKDNQASSTENLHNGLEFNDELFSQLMKDPVKRKLIVSLITSEKDKIEAYKKELAKKNPSSPLLRNMKKPCESPTAIFRRRALQQNKNEQSSDNSDSGSTHSRPTSRLSMASSGPSPVSFENILKGVTAFVEVKTGAKDRSDAVKAHLVSMGAIVKEKITKGVTHVVFKDGSFTTYQKANLLKCHLVSVLWLEACKSSGMKVSERNYPAIGTDAYDHNVSALCSQMQKDYEDIIHEEFQRSIQAGTPLPSAKSLIDRRRTILMTPAGKEVRSFTRRSLQAGASRTNISTDEDITDDESDLGPLIDGDIVDRSSDLFEDIIISTPKKRDVVLSKTNNVHEDMELTTMQKTLLDPELKSSSPNVSPTIYTLQTQQVSEQIPKSPSIENNNVDDIYRRRTIILNGLENDTTATPENIIDENLIVATPKCNELMAEERNTMTPRTLRIFSKNATPDITGHKNDKSIMQDPLVETMTSIKQMSHQPSEKSSSTNMSSLRISDNSKNNSKTNFDKQMTYKPTEKSSSTNMSSLRISGNSKNNNSTGQASFESCKTSFSPLKRSLVNDILQTLENSPFVDDNAVTEKNASCTKKEEEEVENKNTPNDRLEKGVFEHVTVRKKRNQKERNTLHKDDGENNIVDKAQTMTSSRRKRNLKKTTNKSEKTDSLVDLPNLLEKGESSEEVQTSRTRRKTASAISHKNKPEDEGEFSSGKDDIKQTEKPSTRTVVRALEKEFETSDEDVPEAVEKPKSVKLKKNRHRICVSDVKENNEQSASVEVTEDDTSTNKTKKEVKQKKRQTIGPVSKLEKTDSYTPRTKSSRKKTLVRIDASIEENVCPNDKGSPTKKLKMTPPRQANTRRRTMGSASVRPKARNKKISRRTMSTTDLEDIDPDISPDSKPKIRLRKLYSPNALHEISMDDNLERTEKRQAKKVDDRGVFLKPIVVSQKMKNLLNKNNMDIENVINPIQQKEDSKNNKKKKNSDKKTPFNSDDDEQVDLKNELLYRNKNMDVTSDSKINKQKENENDRRSSARIQLKEKSQNISKTQKTPQKRDLTLKLTPSIYVRNRRSTLEFQSLTQSAKKKLKIDKPVQPSIVCTKMHTHDVQVFMQIVKKLGRFDVEDEVSSKTTHLVAGEPKRTINMLRAIARGCWVLKKEWLFKSLENGKWLPEEDYEETNFSPAVEKNRLQRKAFGPTYTMDIFQNCGSMYVAKGSTPRCSDLRELIVLCKGTTTTIPRNASVVIGEYAKNDGGVCVSEAWILDSISQNKKLPFKKYLIPSNKQSGAV